MMANPYFKTLVPFRGNLDFVSANEERLKELIAELGGEDLITPGWNNLPIFPPSDCSLKDWLDFVCWTNTVNFAFTNFEFPFQKFTVEFPEGVPWKGSGALEASMLRAKNNGIPVFDAEYMSRISLPALEYIFLPVDRFRAIPMLNERRLIFNEVGIILLEKYGGTWENLFIAGKWKMFDRGNGVVERLVSDFPSFCDVRYYKGHTLVFHKRAQLLAMMYYGRAFNSNGRIPDLDGIEDIGPIADYEVPKVLWSLGVIEYKKGIERAIRAHEVFLKGNQVEAENRLAMSYAMQKICEETGYNMAQIDFSIWNLGRKSSLPHILVPTTDY